TIRPSVMIVRMYDGTLATSPAGYLRLAPDMLADSTDQHRGERNEILARRPLVHDGRRLGEVFVLGRPQEPAPGQRPLAVWLYFPIAAALSAALGLVLVRLLVGRLRALEQLAARIAAGDLSARVTDSHRDEIGRVAAQLDRMAERLAAAREELAAHEQQR